MIDQAAFISKFSFKTSGKDINIHVKPTESFPFVRLSTARAMIVTGRAQVRMSPRVSASGKTRAIFELIAREGDNDRVLGRVTAATADKLIKLCNRHKVAERVHYFYKHAVKIKNVHVVTGIRGRKPRGE